MEGSISCKILNSDRLSVNSDVSMQDVNTVNIVATGDGNISNLVTARFSSNEATFKESICIGKDNEIKLSNKGFRFYTSTIDPQGNISFEGSAKIGKHLTATSANFSGAISAKSFGSIYGSSAVIREGISAESLTLSKDLWASDITVDDITANSIELNKDLKCGSGSFANDKINFNSDGSIECLSNVSGLSLGLKTSGVNNYLLKGSLSE